MDKRLIGILGEKLVCKWYTDRKYKLLGINYKTRFGEIDIIAQSRNTIVFVEVKTRSGDGYGQPSEAVDYKKREKYFKIATDYLMRTGESESVCRFDVVEIEKGEINHIFDAFSV